MRDHVASVTDEGREGVREDPGYVFYGMFSIEYLH